MTFFYDINKRLADIDTAKKPQQRLNEGAVIPRLEEPNEFVEVDPDASGEFNFSSTEPGDFTRMAQSQGGKAGSSFVSTEPGDLARAFKPQGSPGPGGNDLDRLFGPADEDLKEMMRLSGLSEDDMEEGNEFSGALDAARKSGAKTFDVDGQTYPVKEGTRQGVAEGSYNNAMAGLQKTIDFAKQHGYKIYRSPSGRKMRFVNKELGHEIRAQVDNDGDSINVNFMDYSSGTSGNDDASYFDQTFKRAYEQALKMHQYRSDDDDEGPYTLKQLRQLEKQKQGMAEGVNDYLWHGSRKEHDVLYPRQANDTGGKEESNKNAVYATPNAKVAIAMGLTTPGSDTGMFPNDLQMVLFKGGIRKGQMVYLHKVPKDLFIKHNGREWFSKPEVKEVRPIEVVKVPVDKWLHLIRQATPKDLELRKKYMKQGVAEGLSESKTYGVDNPYEVQPGENFDVVFRPGRHSGVHYALMTGTVTDPFHFRLNGKVYSVSGKGDGIPRPVGAGSTDLGADVPMPRLSDYFHSPAELSDDDPDVALAKEFAKIQKYDPKDMEEIGPVVKAIKTNPAYRREIEAVVRQGVAEGHSEQEIADIRRRVDDMHSDYDQRFFDTVMDVIQALENLKQQGPLPPGQQLLVQKIRQLISDISRNQSIQRGDRRLKEGRKARRPDFPDLDHDGNTTEPIGAAARSAKGHQGEIEKTSKGIRHTRRYDDKTGETEPGQEAPRRGRPEEGGPKHSYDAPFGTVKVPAWKGPRSQHKISDAEPGQEAPRRGRPKKVREEMIDMDVKDPGEYDREGEMAKDLIKTVVRHAEALEKILGDNDNLPEWVQSKLAKIEGMMTAVDDYMQNQKMDSDMPMTEEPRSENQRRAAAIALRAKRTGEKTQPGTASAEMADMSEKELRKFAKKPKGKTLPKKVKETTTSGSVAVSDSAPKKSSGGVSYGKGIYDSWNRELEGMISESMDIVVNQTTQDDGTNSKRITVSATDQDAEQLAQLLNLAGMDQHDDMHDDHVCPVCHQEPCECAEIVDENSPDWPTSTEYNDDALQYSGGLNRPKTTGQTTVPVIASQFSRQISESNQSEVDELDQLKSLLGK